MNLDPHDDDEWMYTDPDDEPWEVDDFPLSVYAVDIVRVVCFFVAGVMSTRALRYAWEFLRYVVPT